MTTFTTEDKLNASPANPMPFPEYIVKEGVHPAGLGGSRTQYEFPNGWGASVVSGTFFYCDDDNPYELGVFKDGHLHYDNPVAEGDVVGYLNMDGLAHHLQRIIGFDDKTEQRYKDGGKDGVKDEVIQGASGAQYQHVDLTQFYKPLAEIPKQPVSSFTQAQQNEIKTLIKESIQEILNTIKKQN